MLRMQFVLPIVYVYMVSMCTNAYQANLYTEHYSWSSSILCLNSTASLYNNLSKETITSLQRPTFNLHQSHDNLVCVVQECIPQWIATHEAHLRLQSWTFQRVRELYFAMHLANMEQRINYNCRCLNRSRRSSSHPTFSHSLVEDTVIHSTT